MNKTLLKISLLTTLILGAAFSSVPSLSQNKIIEAYASNEIKPFASYEFNDASKPGKDSSGNGFDLEMAGNHSGSKCEIVSSSYLDVVNPSNAMEGGVYSVATDGNNLYAPQLGNSGYDFSDMITGSYTISFRAKFDPLVKNPANYVVSFGLYEDCFTFVPYTRKYGSIWYTIIELQFHNSGREGLTHDSETKTSDTGRIMDTLVSKYIIWGAHNDGDPVPDEVNDFKNNWHTFTIVGDAINNKAYLYINGEKVKLTSYNYKTEYEDGVEVPNGIKLTDLSGKTGRSYTFSLGAQMTFNKGSGRQYGTFSMDYFKIYNCALSSSNVSSLHSDSKAYYENEVGARYITRMYLDKLPSLDITDSNSISSMIAGGNLPKIVKAELNDGSSVDMPVFWYDDPDDTAKKVHAIPSIGKKHNIRDTDEPDFESIEGIFNPSFELFTLNYNYVVDFTYNQTEFEVSNIKVANTAISLDDLPYKIDYKRGNNTLITFDVTLLRDHSSLEKIMYDGINRIGSASLDSGKTKYSCKVYATKGANIQLVMGIETATITYYDANNDSVPYGYSTYTYGGDEDLLDPEVINAQLVSMDGYVEGYYSDKACTQIFTKEKLNYYNPIDLNIYFKKAHLADSYTLKLDVNDGGGTVTGQKEIYERNDGEDPFLAKITVTPANGFIVDSISWNSESIFIGDNPDTGDVESATTYIYFEHSITVNSTLTVRFRKLNSYKITPLYDGKGGEVRRLNYDEHGTRIKDGDFEDPYIEGEEIHIDISPIGEYTIESIEWDGELIQLTPEQKVQGYSIGDEKLIFANKAYTLIVKFAAPKTYKITPNYMATNGTISGIENEYKYNDLTNIILIPNPGYHIESVQWGRVNIPVENQNKMVINRVIEDNVQLIVNFAQDVYYEVVSVIRGSGSGTVSGLSSNYLKGSKLENIVIRADEGSYISQIMWGYNEINIDDNHEVNLSDYECIVDAANTKLTVTFEENPKNIVTISQLGEGVVTGKTIYEKNETTAEFTIIPAAGYVIEDVRWNGIKVKDNILNNILKVDISNDSILVVKFGKESSSGSSVKDVTHKVNDETINLNVGYDIYGISSNPVFIEGENYKLYVAPKDGYSITGVNILTGNSFTDVESLDNGLYLIQINNITGDVSFEVSVFNNKQHKITINSDGIVDVSGVNNNEYYESNKEINVIFTAPVGHILHSLSINEINIDIPQNISTFNYILTIDKDINIVVNSIPSPSKVNLVVQYDINLGTVTGNDNGYYPGEYALLTASSNQGYVIYSISFNGNPIEIVDPRTFTFSGMINGENNLVVVTFVPETTVSIDYLANINEGGTHTALDIYNLGDDANIVITANEGYSINYVKWNDTYIEVLDPISVTISEIVDSTNIKIVVGFSRINKYLVTANYDFEKGDVNGIEDFYTEGDITDIRIIANTGYQISYVSFNGKKTTFNNATEYVLNEKIIDDSELLVMYEARPIDLAYISLLVTEGGTVENVETGYVVANSDVTFSVIASKGYFISKIIIDGEEIEIKNNKSLETTVAIAKDTNIDVVFASNAVSEIGGCANSISGSIIACGAVFTALVGVIIVKKRKGM